MTCPPPPPLYRLPPELHLAITSYLRPVSTYILTLTTRYFRSLNPTLPAPTRTDIAQHVYLRESLTTRNSEHLRFCATCFRFRRFFHFTARQRRRNITSPSTEESALNRKCIDCMLLRLHGPAGPCQCSENCGKEDEECDTVAPRWLRVAEAEDGDDASMVAQASEDAWTFPGKSVNWMLGLQIAQCPECRDTLLVEFVRPAREEMTSWGLKIERRWKRMGAVKVPAHACKPERAEGPHWYVSNMLAREERGPIVKSLLGHDGLQLRHCGNECRKRCVCCHTHCPEEVERAGGANYVFTGVQGRFVCKGWVGRGERTCSMGHVLAGKDEEEQEKGKGKGKAIAPPHETPPTLDEADIVNLKDIRQRLDALDPAVDKELWRMRDLEDSVRAKGMFAQWLAAAEEKQEVFVDAVEDAVDGVRRIAVGQ